MYDKDQVRYFRRDNHKWRKKADGVTVRETHEKLKVLLSTCCRARVLTRGLDCDWARRRWGPP